MPLLLSKDEVLTRPQDTRRDPLITAASFRKGHRQITNGKMFSHSGCVGAHVLLGSAMNVLPYILYGMTLPSPGSSLNTITNLTTQVAGPSDSSELLTNRLPICVNNRDWTDQGIDEDHCSIVVNHMYDHYKSYFFSYYQFVAPDAWPISHETVVSTPIKINSGKLSSVLARDCLQARLMLSRRNLYNGHCHDDHGH